MDLAAGARARMWMSLFFVSALLLVVALSFGTTDALGNPRFGTTSRTSAAIFERHLPAGAAPVARATPCSPRRSACCSPTRWPTSSPGTAAATRTALIALLVVPFFANYLVRMYGWQTLLSDEGVVLTRLRDLGVPASFQILDTSAAVIGGLVYGYIVFMILPLYASLERMDGSLIEAGRDLYGSALRTFLHVTVPATRHGRVRRTGAGLPARHGRLHQRPAARRPRQPHDRQPDPGQVLRRPELAARRRADHGADGAAPALHVRPTCARRRATPRGPADDDRSVEARPAPTPRRQPRPRRAPAQGSGMDRKPRVAIAVTVLFFVLLYLPIVAVVLFSFNAKKSLTVFEGWSLQWYEAFFERRELIESLGISLQVAAVAMVGSVVIGVLLAFGLVRAAVPARRARRT